jgi:hypothetical protein
MMSFSLSAQDEKTKSAEKDERPSLELIVAANRITIKNATVGQKMEVYSVVGLKVEEVVLKSAIVEHTLSVPKGYYILKIGDTVRKVVIK